MQSSSFLGQRMQLSTCTTVRPSRTSALRTDALLNLGQGKKAAKKANAPAGKSLLPGFKLGDATPKQTLRLKSAKARKTAKKAVNEAQSGFQLSGIRVDGIAQAGSIDPILFAVGLSGATVFLVLGLLLNS